MRHTRLMLIFCIDCNFIVWQFSSIGNRLYNVHIKFNSCTFHLLSFLSRRLPVKNMDEYVLPYFDQVGTWEYWSACWETLYERKILKQLPSTQGWNLSKAHVTWNRNLINWPCYCSMRSMPSRWFVQLYVWHQHYRIEPTRTMKKFPK